MANEKKVKDLLLNEEEVLQSFHDESSFSSIRKPAYDLWKKCPVPTTRDEYWKYTRIAPLLNKTYGIAEGKESFDTSFLRDLDAYNLVFVNGVFSSEYSSPLVSDKFIITDLQSAKENHSNLIDDAFKDDSEDHDYFSLLNSAFHQNGPFIWIGKNFEIDKPVRIAHLITDKDRLVNSKGFVISEHGSSVKIIETWDQEDSLDNLINSKMNYQLEENAQVEVIKVQSIGSKNVLITQDFIDQNDDSRFTSHCVSMEGKMIRNNLNSNLLGQGAECNLNGLYMLRGSEHADNHTLIHHAVPNCNSNELYKGILNEKSKGVFNGKVIVGRDAQKTNAFQYNANILLTDDCQVYSKPELEIYADDVKCSHGSTTGQLDDEALFYLQSRGIGKEKARNLLLKAFTMDVLEKITIPELRERIELYISERYHTNDYT